MTKLSDQLREGADKIHSIGPVRAAELMREAAAALADAAEVQADEVRAAIGAPSSISMLAKARMLVASHDALRLRDAAFAARETAMLEAYRRVTGEQPTLPMLIAAIERGARPAPPAIRVAGSDPRISVRLNDPLAGNRWQVVVDGEAVPGLVVDAISEISAGAKAVSLYSAHLEAERLTREADEREAALTAKIGGQLTRESKCGSIRSIAGDPELLGALGLDLGGAGLRLVVDTDADSARFGLLPRCALFWLERLIWQGACSLTLSPSGRGVIWMQLDPAGLAKIEPFRNRPQAFVRIDVHLFGDVKCVVATLSDPPPDAEWPDGDGWVGFGIGAEPIHEPVFTVQALVEPGAWRGFVDGRPLSPEIHAVSENTALRLARGFWAEQVRRNLDRGVGERAAEYHDGIAAEDLPPTTGSLPDIQTVEIAEGAAPSVRNPEHRSWARQQAERMAGVPVKQATGVSVGVDANCPRPGKPET